MEEQAALGIIYIITNKVNSKVYIGQTRKSLSERMRHHFSKYETCTKLKKAIGQYGKDNFMYSVLELVPYSELNERESFYIERYNSIENGYNIKKGNSEFKGRNIHSIKMLQEDIVNDYNAGMNTKDIADKYHIALTSVYNSLTRANVKMRYCKNAIKPLRAKIDINLLVEMKQKGLTTAYIAKYFNVAKSSVKRMVNRHKNIIFPRVSNTSAYKDGGENVL